MKRAFVCLAVVGAVVGARAQQFSSFQVVSRLTGITIRSAAANSIWTIDVRAGASLDYLGTTYQVRDLYGFWILDPSGRLQATGHRQNGWRFDSESSPSGNSFGWHTYPHTGIHTGGEGLSFAFESVSGALESIGFEVRLAQPLNGSVEDTLLVRGGGPYSPVPEPATAALATACLAAAARRRRR